MIYIKIIFMTQTAICMHLKDYHNIKNTKVDCNLCTLQQLCLPGSISEEDIRKLNRLIKRTQPLEKGDYLYQQGQKFHSIFVVRSGSLKSYTSSADGSEQIMGLYLPGEILGIGSMSSGTYQNTVCALETTSLCEIPFNQLESLTTAVPQLHHQLLNLMSDEMSNEYKTIYFLGKKTAQERLATYIYLISLRFKRRGFSANEFQLNLSRNDIANYLNLAVETVSRLFTQFQKNGIIQCEKKCIRIIAMDRLKELSGIM